MKKLLVGLTTLPFLAGIAMAGQPMALNDSQMDMVVAGQGLQIESNVANIEILIHTVDNARSDGSTPTGLPNFPIALQTGTPDPIHSFGFGAPATSEPTTPFSRTDQSPFGTGPLIAGSFGG